MVGCCRRGGFSRDGSNLENDVAKVADCRGLVYESLISCSIVRATDLLNKKRSVLMLLCRIDGAL